MPWRVVLGAALVFAAMAVVAVVTYYQNRELYLTVDELAARAADFEDRSGSAALVAASDAAAPTARRLQVRGVVDYDSVARARDGTELRFVLLGDTGRLPVLYRGIVPDTFESAELVTVGGWLAADGTFAADQLFVQCPSKYEPAPPSALGVPERTAVAPS